MIKAWKKIIAVSLVLSATTFLFTGCGSKTDKIVVGTSADYPPYEFHMEINGKDAIVGFDIDIAKEIAKDLGLELEIKDMEFGGLLADLKTDKVDFVLAGMTPDGERAKEVDFSTIYYNAEHGLVINKKDADKYNTISDLKGKVIGVQKGSIQEDIAVEQIESAQIKALGKVSNLMLELKTSKIDAVVVEQPVANAYVKNNDALHMTDITFKDEEGGSAVAVKKGNKELLESINKTIDRLIKENKIEEFVFKANEMMDNE
ncbi:MAG: ABC transporter substrate-binding protein [Tissierellales bacterium]